jgi:hypothetical protein
MPKGQPDLQDSIEIEREGRIYHGHFVINGRSMTVTCGRNKSALTRGWQTRLKHWPGCFLGRS